MARKNITDKDVCQAYADSWSMRRAGLGAKAKWPEQILMERTGEAAKVCFAAMERAYSRDLIECGVSLHSGWLTANGEKMLALAQQPAITNTNSLK